MQWVRARLRLGGWLALGALALQLVLSFAHIHAGDFAFGRPGPTIATTAPDNGPADDGDRYGFGHDGCAICASIHIAGTLVAPVPPAAAIREPRCLARLATAELSAPPRIFARAFKARAPPRA